MAAGLEKTVAAAGPAVQAINPAATMSENTPAIPFRLALIPWRMCVTFPLDRLRDPSADPTDRGLVESNPWQSVHL